MKKKESDKEYRNQFTINRAKHNSNYTCITNLLIKDDRLSATEKGIMALILSNDDKKYILYMSVLQKTCRIGDDKFNSSIKNLVNLGYINKRRFQGGIHWTINEIPSNGNSKKSTKPENTSSENTSGENTSGENTNSENTPCVNTSLINNKASAETGKPVPPEKEVKIEKNNNATGWVEDSEISSHSKEGIHDDVVTQILETTTQSNKNDLELILQQSVKFRRIFENNSPQGSYSGVWTDIDISNYSNAYIAHLIALKIKDEPIPVEVDAKVLNLLWFLVKYSKEVDYSNLWQSFLAEVNNDNNIINKLSGE